MLLLYQDCKDVEFRETEMWILLCSASAPAQLKFGCPEITYKMNVLLQERKGVVKDF